ncbi:MAG: agmatinase [Chloroflexi bacterium]|nr:agmatinase [Chloroflexota bacterium]
MGLEFLPPFVPYNFLALSEEMSAYRSSRFVVLPVPYDSTTSYKAGAREGPRAIIEASRQLEDWDHELQQETCRMGIHTLPELEPHAGGPQAMAERVAQVCDRLAKDGKTLALLGGEHSVSPGAVRSLKQVYPDLSVLYLDAHGDMREEYQGTPFSHACAARRVRELCPLVMVGVRSMSSEEWSFVKRESVPVVFWERGTSPQEGLDIALTHLSSRVYISVDLDVLDPSVMPAVGTPEPGGMGWWDLLFLLRGVAERKRVVGFDVTELCPREGPSSCAYVAAKLVYKMMGYATLSGS